MRTIENNMIRAIRNRKSWQNGNTRVERCAEGQLRCEVFLHGHKIAIVEDCGTVWVTLAGWPTVTTRSRVNAVLSEFVKLPRRARVGQHKHAQFFRMLEDDSARTWTEREIDATEWIAADLA